MFGHTGRAVIVWALCKQDDHPAELTRLDRHEAAHTLITALAGPDQDPPFLFIEGWAESQSADRDEQISSLADKYKTGQTYSLGELVAPEWYGNGNGPVYWEGGPLVHYLIDHYGGEKLFQLYAEVQNETFDADCQRILGDSWETVEKDFWRWVVAEGARISGTRKANQDKLITLVLDRSIKQEDWQALVDGYRQHAADYLAIPRDGAFTIEVERTNIEKKGSSAPERRRFEFRASFQEDEFWLAENFTSNREWYLMHTGDRCGAVRRNMSGALEPSTKGPEARHYVRDNARDLMWTYRSTADPQFMLPLTDETPVGNYRVESLKRPTGDKPGCWTVVATCTDPEGKSITRRELEIDPAQGWWVTSQKYEHGETRMETTVKYEFVGSALLPSKLKSHWVNEESDLTTHQTMRLLSNEEERELRRLVAERTELLPAPRYAWLLLGLRALVIGCPVCGLILLALSRRGLAAPD
jgi:hypothetical protein